MTDMPSRAAAKASGFDAGSHRDRKLTAAVIDAIATRPLPGPATRILVTDEDELVAAAAKPDREPIIIVERDHNDRIGLVQVGGAAAVMVRVLRDADGRCSGFEQQE